MFLETGLSGSHVMVTGGTRGIGRAIVAALLAEGANVSYCARSVTGDEFAGYTKTNEAKALGRAVDVGSADALAAWVNESAKAFGGVDAIVANASPMVFGSSSEEWATSFHIDIMGFVTLVNLTTPYLSNSPNASVTVISSFMGREYFRSPPAPYGPFKAAQLQHMQELSHYLGPKGIRINAVSPGPITFPGGSWDISAKENPTWVEEQRLKVPMRRLGGPEEIANAVVWLTSRLSSYVCGANLLVDGGIHVGTQF